MRSIKALYVEMANIQHTFIHKVQPVFRCSSHSSPVLHPIACRLQYPVCPTVGVSPPDESTAVTMQDNPSYIAVEDGVALEPNPCYSAVQANSVNKPISDEDRTW